MRFLISIVLLLCNSLLAQRINGRPDFLDPDLPIDQRVNDLISRMTLEEKVSQMVNNAKAIPRLRISEYNWWNECLHGVARAGTATVFPQAIGLAATWDADLMLRIGDAISTEARAKYHDFVRRGERDVFKGLTFWSPNVNIFRDPRWGRGQETYGEDPYLTARMGVTFVKGLQGNDPKYFKVIATPKHFAVHSGPEPERHRFNAVIDDRDLYETYLPAFEACVKEAGAYSIMCAYNRYAGEPCCGSSKLLREILRDAWGFKGYVVSDCGAINDISDYHKTVPTAPEAAALALTSGTDLECGNTYDPALIDAIKHGLLSEKEIDVSVKRLFTARFRLGMFDPPESVAYARIPIEENDSREHRQLAIKAAQESIVLLKNADNTLPLRRDFKRIAVIGPTADSYPMLLGNYNGTPSKYVTPLQGIRDKVAGNTEVVYEPGCDLIEKGAVTKNVLTEMVSVGGRPGLKAEYFKNRELQGEPFFTRVDPIASPNWISGARIPAFPGAADVSSIRWSGTIKVPSTGEFKLIVKSDGGFRLSVDDKVVVEDRAVHDLITKSGHVHLEMGKPYSFRLEYVRVAQWPQLSVRWELLGVDYFKKAMDLASHSDVVIFVGGITSQLEGEEMRVDYNGFKGGDRTDLRLPAVQENLLKSLQSTGTPIVLVLTSGSALAVNWEKEHVPAILQLWYPGEEGGTALADVLFGDYNPAGRLPVTFYKSVDQLPPFEDYNMKGRTYRYFGGEPLFPFGYGLSYTKFEYYNLSMPKETATGAEARISVEVKNAGKVAGDEVVQLYVKNLRASVPTPLRSLEGFRRIHLKPSETKVVEFRIQPRQLAVFESRSGDENGRFVVEPGVFEIAVGGILPGANAPTTGFVLSEMRVVGEPYIIRD
jgi:beta-glucosidase